MKSDPTVRNKVLAEVRQFVTHGATVTQDTKPGSITVPIAFPSMGSFSNSYVLSITLEEFDKISEILLPACDSTAGIQEDVSPWVGQDLHFEVKCEYRQGHMLEHRALVKQGNVTAEFRWS